jgi:hypothetical protein
MATPAECYHPSERRYEGTPGILDYQGMETRRVRQTGVISLHREPIRISTSLAGWDVGLGERESDQVELWFANLLLGHVHLNTLSFKATQPPKSRVAGGGRDRWFGCFRSAPRAKNQELYSHVRPNSPKRKHPR